MMSVEEREKTQYDWTHDKVQIIAATIAFGMGALLLSLDFFLARAQWLVLALPKALAKQKQKADSAP